MMGIALRPKPARVALVTAGLAVAGAVLGAIAGALALGIAITSSWSPLGLSELVILVMPAFVGGFIGFFAAPLVGWLLLRHVPLGRAFGGLVLGTVVGGLAGWFLPGNEDFMTQPIETAGAGFLIAALLMRLTWRKQRADPRNS
jgi:hypothetical protein